MAIATIQEVIDRGNVSIYLSGNDNAKGSLFSPRLAAPSSPVSIAIVTSALTWGFEGGAQTDQNVRAMANYLVWLCGMYGQQAQAILSGGGGGSVTPINPGNPSVLPLYLTSADFADATNYNNQDIVGKNVSLFVNELIQQWLFAPNDFVYTATGINVIFDGFDALTEDYEMILMQINTP